MTPSKSTDSSQRRPFLNRCFSLLPLMAMTIVLSGAFAACTSGSQSSEPAQPTPEPPAPVATAVAQAEATVEETLGRSAIPQCAQLCQPNFWLTASVAGVEAELALGADIYARDHYGLTPLHYAASFASLSVIDNLLDRGADINATSIDGRTPLYAAVASGADVWRGPSHHQPPTVIALLLERGADVNVSNGQSFTPLHIVDDPVIATLLLSYGADIEAVNDFGGRTPLLYKIALGSANSYIDVITLLLDHGANVNARDWNHTTALHSAVQLAGRSKPDIMVMLLNYGADIEARNEIGWTPLHLAMQRPNADVTAILIEHGADVNAPGWGGATPLHMLVAPNDGNDDESIDAIILLREHGADIHAENDQGKTACQVAAEWDRPEEITSLVCP